MYVRTSMLAMDQAVRAHFDAGDGLELWLDDQRMGLRTDDRNIRVRLTGDVLPPGIAAVKVQGQIGGQTIDEVFDPEPNLFFDHVWDGMSEAADVPGAPATSLVTELAIGWEMVAEFPRPERTRWWRHHVAAGGADLRSLGCGGITPSSVHFLDVNADVMWRGDGSRLENAQRQSSPQLRRLRVRSDEHAVADGTLAHVFDENGNFRRTLSILKGSVLATAKTDEDGRITSWINGGQRYTIDRRNDHEAMFRSPAGVWCVIDFDDQGRAIAVGNQTNTKISLEWADAGGLSAITDSNGLITKIERDGLGRVNRLIDSTGRQLDLTRTDFDGGSEVTVVSGEGCETRHRREQLPDGTIVDTNSVPGAAKPRVIERRSLGPLGEERIVHTPDGTVATTQHGVRTENKRAMAVERTSITTPAGHTMSSERRTFHHSSGRTTEQHTIGEASWVKRLSPASSTIVTRTPEGRKVEAVFDGAESMAITTPDTGATIMRYDDQGRPKTRRHNGSEITYGYDQNGRLTWTDFERWRQQLHHDEPGRVISIETPDGWMQFARDDAGRVVAVQAPNEAVTSIDRRPDGKIEAVRYPTVDGRKQFERFEYNRDGLLVRRTFNDGDPVIYNRDKAGRVDHVTAENANVTINYDDDSGQITDLETEAGDRVQFLHDGDTEYAEIATGRAPGRVERAFDERHLVRARRINGEHGLRYQRDADGKIRSIGPLQLDYNPVGQVITTTLGGLTTTRRYDAEGRLSSHETRFGRMANVYFSEQIERDSLGRIIEIREHAQGVDRVITYDFNDQRRLDVVEIDDEPVLKLEYDGAGNITELERQGRALRMRFDDAARLRSVAGAPTTYDDAGNLTEIGEDGAVRKYRFDGFNRMIGSVDARGIEATHVLDAMGRPIEIQGTDATAVRFLWDGPSLAATMDAKGEVDMHFIDSGSGMVPDALTRNGIDYLIITDHLGSVRCVVNAEDGDVVQSLSYDAFGRTTVDTEPGWQPFGFAGGLYDHHSGLVRFGARSYDPFIARFLSRDPNGFAGGQLNLYQYAHGDPINYGARLDAGDDHGAEAGDRDPFLDARPLTLDHTYLTTATWRLDTTPVTTLAAFGDLQNHWTSAPRLTDHSRRRLAAIDAAYLEDLSVYGADVGALSQYKTIVTDPEWDPFASCSRGAKWDFNPSRWSDGPGFLETVGRLMQMKAYTRSLRPRLDKSMSKLTESLLD